MPGWKRDLGKRLDALIVRNVPNVRKAVKWNSPFYGIEGQGWFLSFHVFTHYVKVTFFRGTSLRPVPPGGTEQGRALDRHPRRRPARRGADGDVGEAGRRVARLGSLADRPEDLSSPQRHTFRVPPNPKEWVQGWDCSRNRWRDLLLRTLAATRLRRLHLGKSMRFRLGSFVAHF